MANPKLQNGMNMHGNGKSIQSKSLNNKTGYESSGERKKKFLEHRGKKNGKKK